MKIVVCIKQVPDTKGGVKFKPDGTLDRAAMLTIMNPDDKAGLEAALRLKDQYGAEVTEMCIRDSHNRLLLLSLLYILKHPRHQYSQQNPYNNYYNYHFNKREPFISVILFHNRTPY